MYLPVTTLILRSTFCVSNALSFFSYIYLSRLIFIQARHNIVLHTSLFILLAHVSPHYSFCVTGSCLFPSGLETNMYPVLLQQRPEAQSSRVLQEGNHTDLWLPTHNYANKLGESWPSPTTSRQKLPGD